MRTLNAFSWTLGAVLLVGLFSGPSRAGTTPINPSLVASNTDFALNLYGQLANSTNIFFSPYSISTCLGMVYAGAEGETALQMAEALDFGTNQAAIGPEFGAVQAELDSLQSSNGISLSVANGLWTQTNVLFQPAFLENATTNYDASVQQVDFTTDAQQIAGQINNWVAAETDGMISNLFQPSAITPETRLVLVDAIYFKGGWKSVFNTNLTLVEPFYVSANQKINVPMMQQQEGALYYEDDLLQAVELPYTNSSLAMVVLLPKINGPMVLTPAELSAALNGLTPTLVDVFLPKFKLEMTIDLVPILQNLGMFDAFVPGAADFSGIDGAYDLFIHSATHKAVVEVDETGTVAAGATGIIAYPTVVFTMTTFLADHPFIFLIRDTSSGSILFMGRVDDPSSGTASRTTLPTPTIQANSANFSPGNQQFGFKVSATNATLMVEACTDIASGIWFPVQILTPTNGSAYFSEPFDPSSPNRFYRVRSQ